TAEKALLWVVTLLISFKEAGNGEAEPRAVIGRTGESTILGCDLLKPAEASPPLYVIEWVRFGFPLPIFIKFGLYSPRVDPEYVGRVRIQEGASLRIEQLRTEDQGWYECRVLFLNRPSSDDEFKNGTWIHLTVNSPPAFQETPPAFVEVQNQKPVALTCLAAGNPQPMVTWKRDNQAIKSGDKVQVKNGTLFFASVDRASAGAYTCQATSEEGSITHTTRLLVQGPPVIVVPPQNITVNVTQDAFLACQAEAYPANLTYSWFQGSTNVFHVSHLQSRIRVLVDGSLLVQKTTPEDSGRYTCVPSNGLRRSPSASAFLTVLYPARAGDMPPETLLPIGMRGTIRCPAKASPPLLFINWTKDGQPLELDKFPGWSMSPDGTLVIATSNDDALGVYACIPYNSYGTAGSSAPTQVLLKDPPVFTLRPKEEYFQEVGRELLIPCAARGDPTSAPPSCGFLPPPPPFSGILQYLSLPFFKEMNVDGDWPPEEDEGGGKPPSKPALPEAPVKAALPGSSLCPSRLGSSADAPQPMEHDPWLRTLSPKLLRGSLTSQSSGRGSVSFLRPPSLAPSLAGSCLSSPFGEVTGWQGSCAGDEGKPKREPSLVPISKRRNTSVDENYEWDTEFALESDLLDALQLFRSGNPKRPVSTIAAHELEKQSEFLTGCCLHTVPEERCAALREEFLAYRRRREAIQQRRRKLGSGEKQRDERFEQATLL
uniref:Immunoglobulin superfamily member 9 n=1 Tax=Varanus komodoensis TaxID=61221 RepID=A0A8D2J2A3_VARKO